MRIPDICAALAMMLAVSPLARADNAESFRQAYAHSFEALHANYSNVVMEGICTHYGPSGQLEFKEDTVLYRLGDKAMWTATRAESATSETEKDIPVGSRMVRGGSKELFISATKRPHEKEFEFSGYGPIDVERFERSSRTRCFAAFAPFTVRDVTIPELLSSADYVLQPSSVRTSEKGDTVTIRFDIRAPEAKTTSIDVVLQADTMAIREYTVTGPQFLLRGEMTYDDASSPPKVKWVDTWMERVNDPAKLSRMTFEVKSLKFEKPSEDKFILAGLGITSAPPVEGINGAFECRPTQ